MFNESSIAASSSSIPSNIMEHRQSMLGNPFELIRKIMDYLPINDQINFKIALGKFGSEVKTSVSKLKDIYRKENIEQEDLAKAAAILSKTHSSILEHPEFYSKFDINQLDQLKQSLSEIKLTDYNIRGCACSLGRVIGNGTGAVFGLGLITLLILSAYNYSKLDKAIDYLFDNCGGIDATIDAIYEYHNATQACIDALETYDSLASTISLPGIILGAIFTPALLFLYYAYYQKINQVITNDNYPLSQLERFGTLDSEWQNFLVDFKDLIAEDEINTVHDAIESLKSLLNQHEQFVSSNFATIENKQQLAEKASLVCNYSSFFARHQEKPQYIAITVREEVDEQSPLLIQN